MDDSWRFWGNEGQSFDHRYLWFIFD